MAIGEIIAIAGLVFGFGFVVFFHELGHFLAAKWVGIKVEQFAVGFGQAMLSWRQGMGWTWGSSGKRMEELAKAGADLSRYGETEYRLNWIPLGGYVKMLGQDDLNPNAQAEDPRAFNKKSIPARMLVVSAGVIMNVILAAILFTVVFLMGFYVAPPMVGAMAVNSPAQLAGIHVGDKIVELEGKHQYDEKNLVLTAALAHPDEDTPAKILRDGKELTLKVRPQPDPNGFLSLGTSRMTDLKGLKPETVKEIKNADGSPLDPALQILPGDTILTVNGQPVTPLNYVVFDRALQESAGKPVLLTVRNAAGQERQVKAQPRFQDFFAGSPFNLAGFQPRLKVEGIVKDSPIQGKLKKGDVITTLVVNGEPRSDPSVPQFIQHVNRAGDNGWKVDFVVERDGQRQAVQGVVPTFRTGRGKRGVGIQPGLDEQTPIVAAVMEHSAAERAKIPAGARILKIDNQDVANWYDLHRLLKSAAGTVQVTFVALNSNGQPIDQQPQQAALQLDGAERQTLANVCYDHDLFLAERIEPRQTKNPFVAAAWGVTETRDLLLQFYVTLRRLTQGSVSVNNFMGPIGIVHAGSMFAFKGTDWLIWFLAMISANLAVVNFLPIPIVDGGLFVFLIVEKIQGKPLSARMQTVAQLVGLAIILSVFLLVTYQDIARIFL
jgi:regulator of sigma E protease